MANEIQKTRRTQVVSPSGTASRMGVVDVYTPNISEMFNVAGDSLNKLAENQIKIMDAKWQNNFESETSQYLSNKVNSILQSGEKPDLTKFQEEADGYINGVLSNVPERLSIGAEAFFNQKNLNAFETLRKQANLIEFNEVQDAYKKNLQSSLADMDNHINNSLLVSQSPQEFLDSFNQYATTDLTAFLSKHSEKFDSLILLSQGKLTQSDKDNAEQLLLKEVEMRRVNAIVKSFYQNIDVNNLAEVSEADKQAQLFLRNYAQDEGNVRGVNYDVFKDSTGESVGQTVIDEILTNGVSTFKTIKALNDFNLDNNTKKKMSEDVLQIDAIVKNISNVTTPMVMGQNTFEEDGVPMSPEGFRKLLDSQNINYTTTDITKLFKANEAAINLRLQIKPYFNGSSKSSLVDILDQKENKEYLDTLGITSEQFVQGIIANIDPELEDTLEGYLKIGETPETANLVFTLMRENQVLTTGAKQLLNNMSTSKLFDLLDGKDYEAINQFVSTSVPIWDSLTEGGVIQYSNIDKDSNELLNFFNSLKSYRDPIQLANDWKNIQKNKNENKLKSDSGGVIPMPSSGKTFFNELEKDEGYSVTKSFLEREFENIRSKNYKGFLDSLVPMKIVMESSETARAEIERLYNPEYIKNLDSLVYEKAKMLTKLEIDDNTDPIVVNNIFEAKVAQVMEQLVNEDDYGVTRFAPNSGSQFTFSKDSMEKIHNIDEYTAINYLTSFVSMYLETNYDTDADLRNAFQINGYEVKPSREDIYNLAEQGGLELIRIDGTNDYRVRLNLDFSKKFDRYAYADESIDIKVNGMDFNPSEMFNKKFETYMEERTNKYIESQPEIGKDTWIDPYIMGPLIKKWIMTFKTAGIPFDDSSWNSLQKEYQDKIIDFYEDTANDYAFNYSKLLTGSSKNPDQTDKEYLITNAMNIHKNIFEEASNTDSFSTLEENVDIIMKTFVDRLETKPGQVAFLLDVYNLYKPDINELKKAIKTGNVDKLHSLFPDMGDMQKRILTYTFSPEYYEIN